MAISTIGNITYINQNMQTTSAAHANAMQRPDIIPKEFEDKMREIEEVRPTDTENKINKDAKGNGSNSGSSDENERQNANKKQDENTQNTQNTSSTQSQYLLNIKV